MFKHDDNDIVSLVNMLSDIDWRKNAAIWQGNIVQQGENGLKISTSNSTLKAAVKAVKEEISFDTFFR